MKPIVDRDVNRTCDEFSFLIIVSRGEQFLGTLVFGVSKFGGAIAGRRKVTFFLFIFEIRSSNSFVFVRSQNAGLVRFVKYIGRRERVFEISE